MEVEPLMFLPAAFTSKVNQHVQNQPEDRDEPTFKPGGNPIREDQRIMHTVSILRYSTTSPSPEQTERERQREAAQKAIRAMRRASAAKAS